VAAALACRSLRFGAGARLIVNTQRLFARLLSRLQISVICDVGSMNGADALEFRAAMPDSWIYAFEPNPQNFGQMQMNQIFEDRDIQLVPLAATNINGDAEFFLVDADYTRRDFRRGMSSLYRRADDQGTTAPVRVKTTRLDTFFADKCQHNARLALWIDAEGKAYEVIQGTIGIAERVHLLHIEVETIPCIGSNQRLYPDVKSLLRELGFSECATDQPCSASQFNALFIRSDLPFIPRMRMQASLFHAWLRQLLIRFARAVCPSCLRRYQAMRPQAYDR
jgi:FkbM family methyltransferase